LETEKAVVTQSEIGVFRVLVVDDDETVLGVISRFLTDHGYTVDTTMSGERAVEKQRRTTYDLALLDLKLPDSNGLDVLRALKHKDQSISVLIITGHGTVETAVEAMKLGADDYLLKPFKSLDVLQLAVQRAHRYRDLRSECALLKEQLSETVSIGNIVGKSKKMADIFQLIKKVAPLNSTVLLEGESGTGKELIARAVHQQSQRGSRRFVAINCGAIPANLLESELFGYEEGAFTGAVKEKRGLFEVANRGTIFLDEISEMDITLQVKLLRVIQEKKFQRIGGTEERATDVRIIASTNKDLEQEVMQKHFRKDLYYRINVIRITIPPLRERPEDIPLLSFHFLKKYREEFEKSVKSISACVMDIFLHFAWDGNVRELENVIEHAVAMAEGSEIKVTDLPRSVIECQNRLRRDVHIHPFHVAKQDFEKQYLESVLEKAAGNVTKAAELSSIPRQNIYEKVKKYRLDLNRFRR
jgi:DNA-binding NtrC family response regulator